jgi:hypothetical protein
VRIDANKKDRPKAVNLIPIEQADRALGWRGRRQNEEAINQEITPHNAAEHWLRLPANVAIIGAVFREAGSYPLQARGTNSSLGPFAR